MQVNIPKPCSENWKEMSATQRGAFCQKCAVDVIDFSNKSANEVKQTLKDNIGKHMCGRFKKSQLEDLSVAYGSWENQSLRTFQSKFLWACVIAFGMTLFTGCKNSQAQRIDTTSSSIIENVLTEDSSRTIVDSTQMAMTDSISVFPQPIEHVKGDIDYTPQPDFDLMVLGEPAIEFEEMEIGKIAYTPECTASDTNEIKPDPAIKPERILKGKIAVPTRFEEFLADTVKSENLPEVIETTYLKALVFPNPAVDQTQLSVTPDEKRFYEIELFSINGSKISTIHSGRLPAREELFTIDLSTYPSGMYIIKITSENHSQSLKFNKVK